MSLNMLMNHLWIVGSVILIVYSQCIIRWRLAFLEALPASWGDKFVALLWFLLDPWVISAMAATFLSGLCWIVTLTKFELSYAYPWMASVFLMMMLAGTLFFGESLNGYKVAGTVLVIVGLSVMVRG